VLEDLKKITNTDDNKISFSLNISKGKELTRCHYIFILDADDKGIDKRLEEIKDKYGEIWGDLDVLQHNKCIDVNKTMVGCYIFSDDNGKGKLEDILLPL
jgi:hypothetical protein